MMNTPTKLTSRIFLATLLITGGLAIGCNGSGDTKEATKDTPAAAAPKMEVKPATVDTPVKIIDTAKTRPIKTPE